MEDRNNFGNFDFFFEKKVSDTSCRARQAVSKNLCLGPQNRLWALWRLRKDRKIRKKYFERTGHMTQPIFRSLRRCHSAHKRFLGPRPKFFQTGRRALQAVIYTFFRKNTNTEVI